MIFFISDMRLDLHCHMMVCDGYPLTNKIESSFAKHVHKWDVVNMKVFEGGMQAWKQLLPAFVECC